MIETWNADRNEGLTLTSFSPGSEKKVWWQCRQGHEWKTSIANRVNGTDCPYCANRSVLAGYNDLTTTNPELARQWNTQKNQNLTPQMVTAGTHKSVWWRCDRGHEWEAPVVDRNHGNGCPYCSNRKILIGYNDLVTTDPVLAKQWHPFRNKGLEAIDVSRGSHKKVWWQCEKGHQWQAVVKSRAAGMGCPCCSNKMIWKGDNDLSTTHPDLAEQWHPTKNGTLLPDMVGAGSNRKAWWRCSRGHEWSAVISSRTHGIGCPSCARRRVETGENDLQTLAPTFLLQWHPTKNGTITPDKVAVASNRKIWWQCEKGHEWQARPRDRILSKNCPICSNKQLLRGYNDLQSQFPELALEWDFQKNGDVTPEKVGYGSHVKVWWHCTKGHEWKTTVISRTRGGNCPICANKQVLVGYNDLQTHYPKLAAQWDQEKNEYLKPWDVTPGSNKKVWWQCGRGHSWQATVCARVGGTSCPYCIASNKVSYPEKAIFYYLRKEFPDSIENANKKQLPWLKKMELDVYIPSIRLGVEYDGPRHDLKRDRKKDQLCAENGVILLRVRDDRLIDAPEDSWALACRNKDRNSLEQAIQEIFCFIEEQCGFASQIDINLKRDDLQIRQLQKLECWTDTRHRLSQELIAQWNFERNLQLRPESFTPGSNQKVWWKCQSGHEWISTIVSRTGGSGCPYCANKKVQAGFNDLQTVNPALAKQWHPAKNGKLTPEELTHHSGKKVWWICDSGHEWEATADSRARGLGCPYCSGRRTLQGFNDLQTKNPQIARQWHPNKNGEIKPYNVSSHSNKKVWWVCENLHEWQAVIKNRTAGAGCPFCAGRKKLSKQDILFAEEI